MPRRVLLTGASGQVAQACRRQVPDSVELHALGHVELDIADEARVSDVVHRLRPDLVINAAAYTAVDKAETDPDGARRGNEYGPRHLAAALERGGSGRMIHLSTDFVFDGSASTPYRPDDAPRPLGVYGATKLAGERAVLEELGDRALILRTAWVYSATGSNFVLTMLRLMARGPVRVISDQVGTPTSASSIARVIWRVAGFETGGTFHWTDAGVASWYDFAVAIAEEAIARGLLASADVAPIATSEYPTPARRPAYSLLDKSKFVLRFGLEQRHWRANLRDVLEEIRRA